MDLAKYSNEDLIEMQGTALEDSDYELATDIEIVLNQRAGY